LARDYIGYFLLARLVDYNYFI